MVGLTMSLNPSPGSRSLSLRASHPLPRGEGKRDRGAAEMTFSAFLFQALNGLSTASGLFFIAVGLSLIFGVSRIINIAHGSLYMLGTYIAYTFATQIGGPLGFWGGIVATAIVVGLIGALIEILLLRRATSAPPPPPSSWHWRSSG